MNSFYPQKAYCHLGGVILIYLSGFGGQEKKGRPYKAKERSWLK